MSLVQWLKNAGARPEVTRVQNDPGTPLIRRCYRFSGVVQGVGFRWEAKTLAAQLGLTGWVRNESDGTVTVELQGGEAAVGEFLRVMRMVPRFDITDIHAEELPLSQGETTFRVLY